ncbi:hypothetical protein NQX30_01445 [Candidatus Persebacteraceae bacterium Df01]|jgi:hypothetical protein|uniref:Uncharacterized protein n=1 Tax=Candidatus Doriopsillibacter californiensis TaxID=2970740 RepID=A0ABT7QK35_9GAMM|nr:hypothetical protein [Candidatus Persebacteraceae bacterium Df01]
MSTSLRTTPNFPQGKPDEYICLKDEPAFDATRHLALTKPESVFSLDDLGYKEEEVHACPSSLALTSAFRIFSDEGVAVMQELAMRMKSNRNQAAATGANRLGSYIRGAGYRSQFVRDFCDCPEWLDFLSELAGVRLGRHSVPAVACGINYAPEDITRAIDTWHVDSVSFDSVILLNDPTTFEGGEFQYFHGTKAEGEALLGVSGETGTQSGLPVERVSSMNFPAAGYGFIQQGNMVFHRACRLLAYAERTTLLPSFVVLEADKDDGTNVAVMSKWADPGMLAELARHEAWQTCGRLQRLIDSLPLDASPKIIAAETEAAIADISCYAAQLRSESPH